MSKTIPLQDSVHCGGKYCTSFVHRLHGKTCKACGRYLCLECSHKIVYCKDCEDDVLTEEDIKTMKADFVRECYKESDGKATNFTPTELKEMEDGWEAYEKVMGELEEEVLVNKVECERCGFILDDGYCNQCHTRRLPSSMEEDFTREQYDNTYYKDSIHCGGKATNFTPAELKEMEDGWKAYEKVMGKLEEEVLDKKVGCERCNSILDDGYCQQCHTRRLPKTPATNPALVELMKKSDEKPNKPNERLLSTPCSCGSMIDER